MSKNLQYSQFLDIYKITPSLTSLTKNKPIPKNWPLLFEGIVNIGQDDISFWIADLNTKAICISSNKKLINKISTLEPGQIIFLSEAIVVKHSKVLGLEIEVSLFQTIKEFNDSMHDISIVEDEKATLSDLKLSDTRCVTLAQRLELQNKANINESKK